MTTFYYLLLILEYVWSSAAKIFDGLHWGHTCRYCHLESQLGWNILNDITHMHGPQLGELEQLVTGLASLSPSLFLFLFLQWFFLQSNRTSWHSDMWLPRTQKQQVLVRLYLEQPQCQFCGVLLVKENYRSAQIQQGGNILCRVAENFWPSLILHKPQLCSQILWNKGTTCYLLILFPLLQAPPISHLEGNSHSKFQWWLPLLCHISHLLSNKLSFLLIISYHSWALQLHGIITLCLLRL